MDREAEFQKHLMETFRLEAGEHVAGIAAALVDLEKGAPEEQEQLVESVFREAHSLKGAARSVGRGDMESVCQSMEGLFAAMKRGEVKGTPALFDLLQQAGDLLGRLLTSAEREVSEEDRGLQRELVRKLTAAKAEKGVGEGAAAQTPQGAGAASAAGRAEPGGPAPEPAGAAAPQAGAAPSGTGAIPKTETAAGKVEGPGPPPELAVAPAAPVATGARPESSDAARFEGAKRGDRAPLKEPKPVLSGTAETVRVSWAKLSAVLLLSEEMLSAKLSARQRALQMRHVRGAFETWRKEWNRVAPEVQKLTASAAGFGAEESLPHRKDLDRVLEFLSWNSAFLHSLEARYGVQAKDAEQDSRSLGGMVDNLLADVKKAMMFPFSSLLEVFPKIVRDLARDSGKEAELVIGGEEIEIDRRILEEMKDPLIHLVRNCIDHGIEKPEVRESRKKPRRGRITINIAPKDDKAEIVVGDDGAGITPAQVRSALIKMGALPPDKAGNLTDAEAISLVFQSGLSTSPIVTEVSGHGLGLAIVKEKVEKLGGTVSLESFPERGTTFRILLPLSVATFRGILVQVGGRIFVIPATHVDRAVRLKGEEIRTVENRETVGLGDNILSLERLSAVLELPEGAKGQLEQLQAVVVTAGEERIAFLVDEVLGEQEVLLKSLGPQLARVRNIAGATVLGSGRVAPILNVADLVKSATQRGGPHQRAAAPREAPAAPGRKVLVVEDSITSRTLLKNILESGGYIVSTAVDGVDAFTRLKSESFDLVVSDVDMPRMNGFELTSRIRKDAALAELPVVLVTALGSREDRERGIDAGANAYIVKSSFDQSNLLEVAKRLC